ncbi:MAG TPA: Gfo/Idh/MocA family oxidoreductase [Chloroflexota bacterium]
MAKTYRVGIAGLDHWYAALAAAEMAQKNPKTELTVLAHRNAGQLEETARRFGVASTTASYREVVERDDVDIVVTGCYCSENADLCVEAARRGKHILSVKPVGMTVADADRIVEAVQAAKVRFISNESTYLVSPSYRKIKEWIDDGRIGRPISAYTCLRAPVPRQPWPGQRGDTWWLDPTKSPGGGWLDHSTYHIAALRWLFKSEVVRSTGEVANLLEPNLKMEDFGVANLVFAGGQIATVEVTWTGSPGASYSTFQIVGTDGQIVFDQTTSGKIGIVGKFDVPGWFQVSPQPGSASVLDHLVESLETGHPLVANECDARANLAAGLGFYANAKR